MSELAPLDFSGEITPLKPGTYNARIVNAEIKVSAKGNPYINWRLESFGSPEVNGRSVFHSTPTSGAFVTKLAEIHEAATGEKIDKNAKSYDPQMLVSKELQMTVIDESYTHNGEQKTKTAIKSLSRRQ